MVETRRERAGSMARYPITKLKRHHFRMIIRRARLRKYPRRDNDRRTISVLVR